MNARLSVMIGATVATLAALAFAAGRMTASLAVSSTLPVTDETEKRLAQDAKAEYGSVVRVEPNTIAEIPFDAAYEALRQASPETLALWVKQLEQIPQKPKRLAAIVSFFRTLIQFDARHAKELIPSLNKADRWAAMVTVKEAAPPNAQREVLEILLTYDPLEISSCSWDLRSDVIEEWSKADPLAAAQFLEEHRNQDLERCFSKLVRNWAAYDPEGAWTWIEQQVERRKSEPPKEYDIGLSYLLTAWVKGYFEHDHAAVLDYLLSEKNKNVREAMPEIVGALFKESPFEARDFIQRLPKEERAAAVAGVGQVADRFARDNVGERVYSPQFVAEWMLQFPPEAWEPGIEAVIREWKYKNAAEFFEWMEKLPAQTQAGVASQYDTYLSAEDVAKEFDRVMKISNGATRDLLLQQLMRAAQNDDSRGAIMAELEKSPLAPLQKQELARLIPPEPSHSSEPAPVEDEE